MNWNKYPFIRLVAALSFGILLYEAGGNREVAPQWLYGGLLLFVVGLLVLHRTLKSFKYRWTYGVSVMLVFGYVGYCRSCLQRPPFRADDYNRMRQNGWCMARLSEPPTERDRNVKVMLDVVGFKNDREMMRSNGKLMAYLQKTEAALRLGYGDVVAFCIPIEEVEPPKNPGEFDYRRYLERRGVTGTVYLKEGDWIPTGVKAENKLFAFAYRFRDCMMGALKRFGVDGDEFGVGAAILLGYDDSLPAQVRRNYVAAGSMHILCVSGMHVGIIYLLASSLLALLGRSKPALFVKRLVLLLLIWLYALLTGLSPSILRSALMITMILLGEIIHRKGFALNSIAASAFVLLLVDPNNLFAIGFQLSYAAVIGIMLLQKPIYDLIYFKNRLLDKAWEVTAVSIAAQVATMPFAVYYFNQFTPYFWLSNLLMTPLSFVVILSGMLLLAVSWVPWLSWAMGKVLWLGLHLMNEVVAWIEGLPLSLVKGISMDGFQFGMSLALLLLFWLFVNLKKKRMLMEMLCLSALFALSMAWRSQRVSRQSVMRLYSVRNHTALLIAQGFRSVLVCDEGLLADPSLIDYSLKGHWANAQLPMNPVCFTLEGDFHCALACKREQLLSAQGVLLAFWDPASVSLSPPIEVDYLLVTGKQKADLCGALATYQIGALLIDGSVPNYLVADWKQQAERYQIPCYDLHDGSFDFINR